MVSFYHVTSRFIRWNPVSGPKTLVRFSEVSELWVIVSL